MAKRSADTQLTKDGPVSDGSDGGGQMGGHSQKATVAQLANRRILRGRGSGRRPGTPTRPLQQSTQASLTNTNINSINNTQQQPGGFSFGQQAGGTTQGSNQTNTFGTLQSSQMSGSVGSAGPPSFNPSGTGFNFSVGQGTAVNNPFASNNTQNSQGQSGGYQGSMFNIPPPAPKEAPKEIPKDAPKDPWNETQEFDTRVRAKSIIDTLDRLTDPEKEAYRQESIKPPQFASHAPFKWPEGEPVIKDDPHISWNWTTQSLESTQQLPTANPMTSSFGQSTNQQQQQQQPPSNLFGQNATSTGAQPTSNLFGQQNPHQGQSNSNFFGSTVAPANPPQSAQHTSDIFGNFNSQHAQQPASNLFGQSAAQPQQNASYTFGQNPQRGTSNLFGQNSIQHQQGASTTFGQNATQPQQQQTSNMFGQTATQPQQSNYSMFGQNTMQHQQPTHFQQSTSSTFGQNTTQFEQPTSNMFGQNSTQPQQSNAFFTQTEDSMSTSPDNPSHKSPEPRPGPFAFLNSSTAPGQNDNISTRGQGGSLFDRITKPPGTSTNSTGEGQNSSLMPSPQRSEATQGQGGSLFERLSKPSSTSTHSSGDGQGLTQDNTNPISASDPFALLKAKPVYSGPPTSPTKSPPRPRPNSTLFTGNNPKTAPPIPNMPASQDGKPATSNFFGGIKLPPFSQPTSTSSPSSSKALTSANTQNRESNGSSVHECGTSSTTVVTKSSGDKDLSLSTGDRAIGMPPPPPADFTADQKRELVTGYRLKALDMGLQKRIMKSTTFHTESETVFRFYEERKQAIIDARGLPLEQIAGNKRISPSEMKHEGAPGKRAKLEAPPSQDPKPQARVPNGPFFNRDALSDAGNTQALGPKRKADEDLNKVAGQGATDSAKRARGEDPVSYPSLPASSLNSQTSSIFKNILGSKERASVTDASEPTANISDKANASDPKAPSATMGNSLQSKSPSTSNNSSLFATSSFPSKAAPTASMLPTSNLATDSPPKPAFASMAQPSSLTNANQFSTKSGSTESPVKAPFASMTQSSSSTTTNPFSNKPKATEDTPSAVVKPPTFKPPTFGTGAPTNFLSQFGKTAEETAKKEKEKRKAEDFDSDEDDEAEWERKDAEEQRAKKQKLEEALKPKMAKFIPGKGFVFGDDDTEKQKEKSTQPEGVVPAFFSAQPLKDSGASIFSKQSSTQGVVNSHNIFSHLSDVDSGAEGSKTGDADDEDDGSEGESNHDEDHDGRVGIQGRERISAQQNGTNKSERATPFANSNPFGAANDRLSQSPEIPTSEAPSGRSLFDRISRDESGDAIREVPPADEKKPENSLKSSLFPTTSTFFHQAPSPVLGSNIFGHSPSSKSPLNILGSSTPSKPASNIFSSSTVSTSTSNIFGQPFSTTPAILATDSSNSPQGDHTWKPDTPIKFGSGSDTPGVKVTSPTPSKPSFGGLFGSPPAHAASEIPGKPTSNIFSTTPKKSPSVGFGFAFGGPPKTTTSTLAPPLGAASTTTSRATSPGATTAGESANDSTADGEDDTVGHDEQIDLTSGGPGEEDEDILFEVKAKAMSFDSDKKTWASKGIGLFRVLKHRESGKARMLLRQETIGRIVLNAALLSAMKYEYTNNKSVKMAVASDNGKLATWLIRVGKDDDAQKLASVLEEHKSN